MPVMMHKGNIEAAGRETLRLLGHTYDVLEEHLRAQDLVRDADPTQQRHLDRDIAARWKRYIRNEVHKVENLETVLAVVGTMKAGKSMTINAIVGADVLPSRTDPMTTYPTLVRHKPGQIDPVLHFPLAADFIELGRQAKARIEDLMREHQLEELFRSWRERQSAEQVLSGTFESLVEIYYGREQIFELLEQINDLCRVCAPLDLPLPAANTEEGARLPVIEIEMYHVGTAAQQLGRFTILDSPGPNEFGQGPRLRSIVREQLSQASAVLLVCDFTQQNGDADREIQDYVKEVFSQLTDRVFILVEGDSEEIRNHLSQALLNGLIPRHRIFPVSSQSAFRANWAQRELEINSRLPDPSVNSITADFGNVALGKLWREDVTNPERTKRAAQELWRESLFDEPLEQVIRVAATNAALISLKSAVAKIVEYNQVLDYFLKIRETAATTNAKIIQAEIEGLQSDIAKTESAYSEILQELEKMVEDFSEFMKEVCGYATEDVKTILSEYFRTGQVLQKTKDRLRKRRTYSLFRRIAENIGDSIQTLFDWDKDADSALAFPTQDFPATDFDAMKGKFVVRGPAHEKDAQQLLTRIRERILKVFLAINRKTQRTMAAASAELSSHLRGQIEASLKEILESAQQRLKQAFDIDFEFPKPDLNYTTDSAHEFEVNVIKKEQETYYRLVEQEGKKGKVKRWFGEFFGKQWGYDKVKSTREISTVDLTELRDQAMKKLGGFAMEMQTQAETFVNSVLRLSVDAYFNELKKYIEAFRGDLLDAINDKQLEKDRLQALHDKIRELKGNVNDLLSDGSSLKASLEAV
jgi:Dynamin family